MPDEFCKERTSTERLDYRLGWRARTSSAVVYYTPTRARPPGDRRHIVGPSGKLLDTALERAGIDRAKVYVTNSVKHFKFVVIERGRRLHKKPGPAEVRACRPWLQEEIRLVKPKVIVALGATAAQALLGQQFRVTQHRGEAISTDLADAVIATVHPSAVLRAPDGERERAREEFFQDIERVTTYVRGKAKVAGSR